MGDAADFIFPHIRRHIIYVLLSVAKTNQMNHQDFHFSYFAKEGRYAYMMNCTSLLTDISRT